MRIAMGPRTWGSSESEEEAEDSIFTTGGTGGAIVSGIRADSMTSESARSAATSAWACCDAAESELPLRFRGF